MNKSSMDTSRKIGLLGGSFNPVHIGHLRLCIEILEQGHVDHVQLIPTYVPPHKDVKNILPFGMRCSMLESALKCFPEISVNPLEKERSGPSYTYDTLQILTGENPQAGLVFILGDNDLMTLPEWYKGREIIFLADMLIALRGDSQLTGLDEFISGFWDVREKGEKIWKVNQGGWIGCFSVPRLDVSSTMVRSRWLTGKNIRWLVPDHVVDYLEYYREEVNRIWQRN